MKMRIVLVRMMMRIIDVQDASEKTFGSEKIFQIFDPVGPPKLLKIALQFLKA